MKNKKIKIYLQKPLGISDSSYYRYLKEYPPENVEYLGSKKFGVITRGKSLKRLSWLKQFSKKILKKFNISVPNAYYTKHANKYDLIHCTNCLSKNKQPWVTDMEFIRFQIGSYSKNYSPASKKLIRKYVNSKYCKKIMAWSEWSKKGILKQFPELENKVEIVYPAIPIYKAEKRKKKDKKIRILFVGRDFEVKGGEIALEVLDRLTKKYQNIQGIIVSDVPKKFLEKYKENKKINFLRLVPQDKLFKDIYPSSDIFLYPTFSDTFGFAILEAQSFGLPVIAMKTQSTHTINETIQEGKTGFIIKNMSANGDVRTFNNELLGEVTEKVERLIKDKKLLEKMSRLSRKKIAQGKFSIRERNKKLKRIYREALK